LLKKGSVSATEKYFEDKPVVFNESRWLRRTLRKSGLTFTGFCANAIPAAKDKKAAGILPQITGEIFPNLKIVNGDILEFDLDKIAPAKKIKVIGNLPYYITTPIIEYLIENRKNISSILITLQKEVAVRLTARPGSKDYGPISCYVQYYTRPEYLYTIKRTSFYPVPDVDSSLMRLEVLAAPAVEVKDETLFFKIVRGAFNQRRKSIINSLSRQAVLDLPKEKLSALLRGINIDPTIRPENLTLMDFANLTNRL